MSEILNGWCILLGAADLVFIVYGIIQLCLYTILRIPWAENYWYPDGTGYSKGSTRPVRRRILLKIGVVVVLLIITTIIESILGYLC